MPDDAELADWWLSFLRPIDLEGVWAMVWAGGQGNDPIADASRREQHTLALLEMQELADEARYELGVATRLQYLYRAAVEDGTATPNRPDRPKSFDSLGLSDDALAMPPTVLLLLAGHSRPIPRPAALWDDPHQHMSQHRVLSLWFSAQLVDSAVVRIHAALDRLATALHFALGESDSPKLRIRAGATMLPTFDSPFVNSMAHRYGESEEIRALREVANGELMAAGRDMRDFFVHRGRWRSAGHGAGARARIAGIERPMDEHDHLALGVALFDHVLRRSVAASAALFLRRREVLGFDPEDLGA